MTTILPSDPCAPAVHLPAPTAKTVREVRLEDLLRECLPFVLADTQPGKTQELAAHILKETS